MLLGMAQYRIDQATPGAGTPGVARHDLVPAETITLTATSPTGPGVTHAWEIIDKAGTSSVLSASTGDVVTIAGGGVNELAGWRVRLTSNDNGTASITERVFSVRSSLTGLRPALFGETAPNTAKLASNTPDLSTDNATYADLQGTTISGQNWRGYAQWTWEILQAIELLATNGGGGAGTLQEAYDGGPNILINIAPIRVEKTGTDAVLMELVNDITSSSAPLLRVESKAASRTGTLIRALQYGTAPVLEIGDAAGLGLHIWKDGLRGRVATTIQPDVPSAGGSSGYALVLKGGNASSGGSGQKGGNAQLFGGDSVASGGDPGGAFVDAGSQGGSATKGKVFIGALSAERIDLGSTVNGIPVRFHENASAPSSSPLTDIVQVFGLHDDVIPNNPGIEGTQLFARDALGKLWRITGGVAPEIDNTLSPYALKVTDVGVEVSASAGAVTIILPTGNDALGFKPVIVYIRAGQAHAVTLARGGGSDAINGVTADYVIGATAGAVSPVAVLISCVLSTWVVQQLDANPEAVEVISGATYTVAPGDHKKTYLCTNAGGCTVTVPASGVALGHETTFIGAPGVITFVSGGGGGTNSVAQLPASLSLVTAEAYSVASIKVTGIGVGVGTYTLAGDLLPNTPDPVTDGDFTLNGDLVRTGVGVYSATLFNHAATAAPGVGDDAADGYSVGSRWIDTTNDDVYVCADATIGAAVWQRLVSDMIFDANLGKGKNWLSVWRETYKGGGTDPHLTGAASGTGAATQVATASGYAGIGRLISGTSAAAYAYRGSTLNWFYNNAVAVCTIEWVGVVLGPLADVTDDYRVHLCGIGALPIGGGTTGFTMTYDRLSPTPANWWLTKWAAGVATYSVNTGVAVDLNRHRYKVIYDTVAATAQFFIDGVSVGTLTALTAMSGVSTLAAMIQRQAGASRELYEEFTECLVKFSTPRPG